MATPEKCTSGPPKNCFSTNPFSGVSKEQHIKKSLKSEAKKVSGPGGIKWLYEVGAKTKNFSFLSIKDAAKAVWLLIRYISKFKEIFGNYVPDYKVEWCDNAKYQKYTWCKSV